MEAKLKQLNKGLEHIKTLIERKYIKKKHKDGLERYKMKQRGLPVTKEEVKQRIKAKKNKIKRRQSRINHLRHHKEQLGRKKRTLERCRMD